MRDIRVQRLCGEGEYTDISTKLNQNLSVINYLSNISETLISVFEKCLEMNFALEIRIKLNKWNGNRVRTINWGSVLLKWPDNHMAYSSLLVHKL